MDIATHAIVGAATGAVFGHPIAGAIVAVAPDLVLGFKRKELPTELYDFTHSPLIISALLFFASETPQLGGCLVLCYLTHIVLDIYTHGPEWAPKLLAPFSSLRYTGGLDWEWFNGPWWAGFSFAFGWTFACLGIVLLQ